MIRMIKKYLLLLFLYWPAQGITQAPAYNFYHTTTASGLPTNTYEFVYRDSYGFLWLASFDGLFRWDGYTFRKYNYEERNPRSISNNIVYTIFEDSRRNLWIGTLSGLNLYNRLTDDFTKIILRTDVSQIPVNVVLEDHRQQLWLGTSFGLCRYDAEQQRAHWYLNNGDDVIFCMAVDNDNNLWAGTFNTGLKKIIPATGQWLAFTHRPGDAGSIPSNRISAILVDSRQQLWVGTDDEGLVKLDRQGKVLRSYRNFSLVQPGRLNKIRCLYEDTRHTLWIGVMRDQLHYLRPTDTEPVPVTQHAALPLQERLMSITSIREDDFGNTWFASQDNGLFNTNTYKNHFRHYLMEPGRYNGLQSSAVNCFLEQTDGHIWVGTNGGGILSFDPRTRTISPVLPQVFGRDGISDMREAQGKIWVATWGAGLKVIDKATQAVTQYRHHPNDPHSLVSDDVKVLLPDDSLIWMGTNGEGLVAFNTRTKEFIHHKNNHLFPFDLHAPAWINHLFKDSRKRLWISTYSGVFVFDGKELRQYAHSADTNSITGNSVNRIVEDRQGRIWIVHEAGLDRFEEEGQHFRHYTIAQEQPAAIKTIVPGKNNSFWLSANEGLFHFDPASGVIQKYDVNDGLAANAYQKTGLCARDGTYYFGDSRGFNAFVPDSLQPLQLPYRFYFTDLVIYNEVQQAGASGSAIQKVLAFTDTLTLDHTRSFFSIGFAALNLYAPVKTRYSYQLQGLHDQWIDLQGERKVAFTNLPAGHYTLLVRFTDAGGNWLPAGKNLHLVILPPWWQTWWFRLLVVMAIACTVCVIFYARVAAIKKRNRLLKEEVNRRTSELHEVNASLVEQHDEIRMQKEKLEASHAENLRQTNKILEQQQHIVQQNQALASNVLELEKVNSTKDRFFSILAHDLKNPVFALTDMAAYVKQHLQRMDKRELERYLDNMHNSSSAVYELLMNLLNWSRAQSKKMECAPTGWNLQELVARNIRLLESQYQNKHIRVQMQVAATYFVYADYHMIDTVIRNLLTNSIKFTDYNGSVTISASEADERIRISLADTGVGMTAAQLEKLFSIDKTVIAAGTAGETGTGLGLVVAKEFVEINKGAIEVESTPGKGSVFSVILPAAGATARVEAGREDMMSNFYDYSKIDFWDSFPEDKLAKIKGRKILIVEDNREVRDYLKRLLSGAFEIFEAADGSEGLRLAVETPPDLIITDLLMPGIDGLEFCKEIKSHTDTSHIPVVILTSQWEPTIEVSGYEAGAALYLTKPVRRELLIQVILNLLQEQEKLQDKWMERMLDQQVLPGSQPGLGRLDEEFLHQLVTTIEAHIADPNLDARMISRLMATSRTVLYAKIKALTGQTVHEFIKSVRLKRSLKLLLEGRHSINQVAFDVGFSSHSYFDKCFIKQFGMGPREYIRQKKGMGK